MRRLSLRVEHLTDLSTTELEAVAGAAQDTKTVICLTGHYPTIEVTYCFQIIEEITGAIDVQTTGC
jgi:hypothetical protein